MPFKSEKQREWMWANEPELAQEFADEEKKQKKSKRKSETQTRRLLSKPEEFFNN